MTKEQFLLMKLAEECAEVAQRAIKSMQYGSQQVWKKGEVAGGREVIPDEGLNNAQRLTSELMDLGIMCGLLEKLGAIAPPPKGYEFEEMQEAKIAKLNKYLAFSRELGIIEGDWTI
jgi:hypothetical protein